ncbi:MAG: YfhO family protein [Calditrichaeota bacterium]|nr:YfhO family protein [Calditrichota bacterium]
MAKKHSAKNVKSTPQKSHNKPIDETSNSFWNRNRGTIISVFGLYLLLVIFFAPVVFENKGLTPAPDMMAVSGMNKMGEEAIFSLKNFHFPLWNPTLFCGLPMFAGLQYALFTYPPEYIIRACSYIFGFGEYNRWLFHYLMAGFFVFLLARHFKCGRLASWLAGAAYMFSPQLIVLVDVAHGSKLMGIVYLPLIWLLIDRLRLKPTLGRAAALGGVFAVEILSLHPQVAAYGGMLMGLYLLYYGIDAYRKGEIKTWVKTGGLWIGSMVISLAVSAVLWMSVLDYARYSIRGAGASGVAGGGVDWSYATGWSFHPLESITYLFPSWFGFAGGTYWGTVGTPAGQSFTQNPMYFGIVIVLLFAFALATVSRARWGFPLTLGIAAWVLSFGKYLPILYGPFFHFLPLFNKFRAPVMGQVLLLLAAVILAGMGLQALIDKARKGEVNLKLIKVLYILAGIAALKAFVAFTMPGFFSGFYHFFAEIVQPGLHEKVLALAEPIARADMGRVLLLMAVLCVTAALALSKKVSWWALTGVVIIIFLIDLIPINHKLVSFHSMRQQDALLIPEGVVKRLSKDTDKFRVHPLDKSYPAMYWQNTLGVRTNANPANWLSYFDIESTTGYFGAKPAPFQKLMTVSGLDENAPYSWQLLMKRPQLLDALNVRYILTTIPLETAFAEMSKQGIPDPVRPVKDYRLELMPREARAGGGAFLYRNPGELARVRFVENYRVIEDFNATLNEMMRGVWNPAQEVLLEKEPGLKPEAGGNSSAKIVVYKPEEIDIQVVTEVPKLMVLADTYYPSGWKARIDGKETEIIRADAVLRAIVIPAGSHDVTFRFWPVWFYTGLWISLITTFCLLGTLGFWLLRKRKRVVE